MEDLKRQFVLDIVEQHPEKPWSWYHLSTNPCITFDIVERNKDKPWEWDVLSSSNILMNSIDESDMCRRHFASKRIQRQWHRCISNPSYKICKKRLSREFNNLK